MDDEIMEMYLKMHNFNQDLMTLNIKYSEQIEEQSNEIKRLHNLLQEIKEYVNVELLSSNADYYRKNGGYVSGSDLDVDYIFPILDIIDKENNNDSNI